MKQLGYLAPGLASSSFEVVTKSSWGGGAYGSLIVTASCKYRLRLVNTC